MEFLLLNIHFSVASTDFQYSLACFLFWQGASVLGSVVDMIISIAIATCLWHTFALTIFKKARLRAAYPQAIKSILLELAVGIRLDWSGSIRLLFRCVLGGSRHCKLSWLTAHILPLVTSHFQKSWPPIRRSGPLVASNSHVGLKNWNWFERCHRQLPRQGDDNNGQGRDADVDTRRKCGWFRKAKIMLGKRSLRKFGLWLPSKLNKMMLYVWIFDLLKGSEKIWKEIFKNIWVLRITTKKYISMLM